MLKIFCNEKSDSKNKIHITLKGNYCQAEVTDLHNGLHGIDVIENIMPYNSYSLVDNVGKVKIYRKISHSDFKWLDLNRLGVSIRMDFAQLIQLYSTRDIIQLDSGMYEGDERDVVIRIFEGSKEMLTVDADQEYELLSFNSDDLVLGDHPRMTLWDSYALSACGMEYKANRKSFLLEGDFSKLLSRESGKDYIEFTIQKYKGDFSSGEKLTRDIDDEEVLVDCSVGCIDNRRVRLENGVGKFRLFTFGYTGPVKIKLGRKWYEVWNDYSLIIGG